MGDFISCVFILNFQEQFILVDLVQKQKLVTNRYKKIKISLMIRRKKKKNSKVGQIFGN